MKSFKLEIVNNHKAFIVDSIVNDNINLWNDLDGGGKYKLLLDTENSSLNYFKTLIKNTFNLKNIFREPSTYQAYVYFKNNTIFDEHVDIKYKGYQHKRYNIILRVPNQDCYFTQNNAKTKILESHAYEIIADKPHGLSLIKGCDPLIILLFSFLEKIND